MPNPPTLSEMRHALADIAPAVTSSDSGKGKKKGRGGGDFDESKVKRDGSGQFAKTASAKVPANDVRTPEQIDASWKADIGRNKAINDALYGNKGGGMLPKIEAKVAEIKKRTGIDVYSVDKVTPAVAKVATEFMKYVASESNKILSSTPASLSPSKTQRVQIQVTNPGTAKVDYKYVFVDVPGIKHSSIPTLSEMEASFADVSEEFLEHFGVKGMRWGFRRTDAQLAAGKSVGGNKSDDNSAPTTGTAGAGHHGGSGSEHVAVDAERLLESLQKSPSQMSTREIKEANARVEALKKYNELFNPAAGGNAQLQAQVAQMKLQKEFLTLQRDLTPPSKMSKLLGATETGYKHFETVDKLMGGKLSAGVTKKLGLDPPLSLIERLSSESKLADAKTANIKAKSEYNQMLALQGALAAGDAASKAEGYAGAGKRAKSSGFTGEVGKETPTTFGRRRA